MCSSDLATSYNWTVSGTQASIISGNGTTTIQISVPNGFSNAQIGVAASNCIGSSSINYRTVYGTPVVGSGLTGSVYPCASTTGSYSIGAVAGATSYSWSITGNASIASSSGTSCTVNFASTWAGGTLTVNAINSCGTGSRSFTLYATPKIGRAHV